MHTKNILAQYYYAKLIALYMPIEINHIIAKLFLQLHSKSVHSMLIPHTCIETTTSFPYQHRPVITTDQSFIIYKFINGFTVYNAETSQKISSLTTNYYDICKRKNTVIYQNKATFKIILYNISAQSYSEIIILPTSIKNIKISPNGEYILIIDTEKITLYDIHDHNTIQSYIIEHDIDAKMFFSENNTLISFSKNNNDTKNIHTWKIDYNTKQIIPKIILSNTAFDDVLLSPDEQTLSLFNKDEFHNVQSGSILKKDKQGYFCSENALVHLEALTQYNKKCITSLENDILIIRNINGDIIYTKQINTESFKELAFSHNKQHIFIPIQTMIKKDFEKYYNLIIHFDDSMKYKKETYIHSGNCHLGPSRFKECSHYMLDVNKQGLILLRFLDENKYNIKQHLLFYDNKGNYLLWDSVSNKHKEKPYFTVDGRKIIYNGSYVLQLYDEKQEQQINQINQTITCQQALFLFHQRNVKNFSITKKSYEHQAIHSFEPDNKTFLETILKFKISKKTITPIS